MASAMTPGGADRAILQFDGSWRFLSNFHPCPVEMPDGLTYPSAEHAYQAQKTADIRERMGICRLEAPGMAKRWGKRLTLIPDWDKVRKRVMLEVVLAKFWQHPDLAAWLAATVPALLVEGNHWHDNFWGDCYCGRAACAAQGANYLGEILMAVRFVTRDD